MGMDPPVGGTFWFQIFIQAPPLEIWRKTISGTEGGSGEEVGWPIFGYLLWEKIIGGELTLVRYLYEVQLVARGYTALGQDWRSLSPQGRPPPRGAAHRADRGVADLLRDAPSTGGSVAPRC